MPVIKRARRIQSLLFPKSKFSVEQAKSWAESHERAVTKIDRMGDFHRLHQFELSCCKGGTVVALPLPKSGGVLAVVCEQAERKK